ncbi:YraN family protein [Acanthopleuribacter pedis]|uniref:UPF0102 protein J3U88_00545 n=1 Tax=Acanthopleuribacter pedis TaxID=442870 RepID=A0A8J7PYE9_9BACT|nr:YraN family protein [Acanthopleuribacter pedis]MBO1316927.1 YraN family protein [Acanthopleuribacter pedis]
MIFQLVERLRGMLMPTPFWPISPWKRGEYLARRWYHRRGYHLLAKNWRHGRGEIDLIMANPREVVFVEVKARSGTTEPALHTTLSPDQKKRLTRLAQRYLNQWPEQRIPWRFDLVLVWLRRDRRHRIICTRMLKP